MRSYKISLRRTRVKIKGNHLKTIIRTNWKRSYVLRGNWTIKRVNRGIKKTHEYNGKRILVKAVTNHRYQQAVVRSKRNVITVTAGTFIN